MSAKDEGGQAFPVPSTEDHHYIPGMTLRDYFAGQALAAAINIKRAELSEAVKHSQRDHDDLEDFEADRRSVKNECQEVAWVAYDLADAMLVIREESK
jgi:hypothetical protein